MRGGSVGGMIALVSMLSATSQAARFIRLAGTTVRRLVAMSCDDGWMPIADGIEFVALIRGETRIHSTLHLTAEKKLS